MILVPIGDRTFYDASTIHSTTNSSLINSTLNYDQTYVINVPAMINLNVDAGSSRQDI